MIASSIPLKTESGTGKQPPSTARGSTNDNRLSQFLKRIRKRARRWIFIDSISLIGLTVAVWFWGTLFLDWLIEPPPIVRLLAVGNTLPSNHYDCPKPARQKVACTATR